jgi:hypothetical protein
MTFDRDSGTVGRRSSVVGKVGAKYSARMQGTVLILVRLARMAD